jgi:hypothetical protein
MNAADFLECAKRAAVKWLRLARSSAWDEDEVNIQGIRQSRDVMGVVGIELVHDQYKLHYREFVAEPMVISFHH